MAKHPRLGKQPSRYTFFLNPYTDARFTNEVLHDFKDVVQFKPMGGWSRT